MRRARFDWTPTIGVAVAALTTYLVYTSLRLDRVVRQQGEDKAVQRRNDEEAANDRDDLRTRSDTRARRIGYALTALGLLVAALAIKGVSNLLFH